MAAGTFHFAMFFTLATVYALAVDGRIRHFWVLLLIYLVPLAFGRPTTGGAGPSFCAGLGAVSGAGQPVPAGPHSGCFATWIQSDGKYHATWGDRPDGRRLRTLYPMAQISPYIMVTRNSLHQLLLRRPGDLCGGAVHPPEAAGGMTNFGLTHVLLAAYVRTVAKYPGLNRFLAGQKVYSRGRTSSSA